MGMIQVLGVVMKTKVWISLLSFSCFSNNTWKAVRLRFYCEIYSEIKVPKATGTTVSLEHEVDTGKRTSELCPLQ
jgi:hypothetical protein